jgi:hypothetical protein
VIAAARRIANEHHTGESFMRTIEAVAVPVADTKDIVNARREANAVPRLSVPLQETVKAEMRKRRKGAQREAATKCRDNSPLR